MDRQRIYFLVPLVVGIFGAVFAVGNKMTNYYCGVGSVFFGKDLSGWQYCEQLVVLVHIVVSALVALLVLAISDYSFQTMRAGIVGYIGRRAKEKAEIRTRGKIMTLTAEPLQMDGHLDLRIHNNEDSFVVLREATIFDENTRYRVSVESQVRVEAHGSRTTRFIREDNISKSLQYHITGHHSGGSTTDALFGQGIREFQVAVTYDSDEKRSQGTIKRYLVTVDYKAEHDFDIKIQDAD